MTKNTLLTISFLVVLARIYSLPLNTTCKTKNYVGTCILYESCPRAVALGKLQYRKTLSDMVCGETPKKNTTILYNRHSKVCCPIDVESTIVFKDSSEKNLSTVQQRPNRLQTLAPKEITTELEHTTTTLETTTMEIKEITEELLQPTLKLPLDPFPDRNTCGRMVISSRIIGGKLTGIDEFPWLARLAYKLRGEVTFACAASLITDRYLLTAAHCLSSIKPFKVRLGEWDELTTIDCIKDRCNDKAVDIKILETNIFPGFNVTNKAYGDIGLIKLEEPVKFTDFVRPICLPTTDYVKMQDYVDGSSYWAAGWGITEYGTVSSIKRKVLLDAVPRDVCQAIYPKVSKLSLSQIICAGGILGKDTCNGDSGGPLMKFVKENYKENWYIYGIISLGHDHCGSEGHPGFYTRVTKYMDWIRKTISN